MKQVRAVPATNDEKLNGLLQRINRLTRERAPGALRGPCRAATSQRSRRGNRRVCAARAAVVQRSRACPPAKSKSLILKLLLSRGDLVGRDIAEHIRLPFVLVDELLRQLKSDQLVVHRGSAPMNDYLYQLTDLGRERARRYAEHCTYFGAAPVTLADYVASVQAQSLEKQHPTQEDLQRAFDDLLINPQMLDRLGPAINSGRGLFLFGAPGNGKTSIAERVTRGLRPVDLDSARDRRRRRDHPAVRPDEPRRTAAGEVGRAARQLADRPPLGPHPPAHDRRRRRTDDGQPGSDAATRRPASAKRPCK